MTRLAGVLATLSVLAYLPACSSTTPEEPEASESQLAERPSMQTANKQTVQSFFDQFNAGKTAEAFTLVSDDVTWWVPGTLPFSGTKTKAQYLGIVGQIQAGFPTGFKLAVKHMIAEDDEVAAEVESEGTHVNGKAYRNKYHFLFKVKGGSIVSVKEYMDTLHLYQLLAP
jgi:ketosteroid isomerase-like protein